MLVDHFIDDGDRGFGEDAYRGNHDVEVRGADLARDEQRLVLPGDQHVANTAAREGDRRSARAGVEHGRVAIDAGQQVARLALVVIMKP